MCAPGLVLAMCWEPSASPELCLAGASSHDHVSSSSHLLCLELLREEFLISNTLTQFNVGSPGCRICRRSLSSQLSWGCRRDSGQSNTLSALTKSWLLLAILLVDGSWAADLGNCVFWAGRRECDSKGEMREEGEWRALHRGDTLEGRAGKLRPWSICTTVAICGWMQTTVRQ